MSRFRLNLLTRLATLLCLALSLTFSLALQGAEAQVPGNHPIYLPLVIKGGGPASTHPYLQMLQRVQQICSATGLNQVCYANGQITLQPKTGTSTFIKPGDIADLANVQSLSLASTGADSQKWSVAWLRLQAGTYLPDQELTILAFGNVQLSDIKLLTGQVILDDTELLPSLQFTSSPIAGVAKIRSSGLVVTNPAEEALLSLALNGAGLTLGSSAYVETEPIGRMVVALATGSSLIEASGGSSAVVSGQQVTVPLGSNGQVSGPPAQPTKADSGDEFVYLDGTTDKDRAENALNKLNRAIDRCLDGRSAYVYNVLYWRRIIELKKYTPYLDPAKLSQAYNRAPNCLTFELDFDSLATTVSGPIIRSSHLHTLALRLQFNVDGSLKNSIGKELVYLKHAYQGPVSCPTKTETTNGTLEVGAGSLKIAFDKIRVSTDLQITRQPTDKATLFCPKAPPQIVSQGHWVTNFYYVHENLKGANDHAFSFKDWEYKGGWAFASLNSDRTRTNGGIIFGSIVDLHMTHIPQR